MKPKTEEIPKMVDNLITGYNRIEVELIEQTAGAMYYRDCLDGQVEILDDDPFGDVEPETRKGWIQTYNYLLQAIQYLRENRFLQNTEEFIEA